MAVGDNSRFMGEDHSSLLMGDNYKFMLMRPAIAPGSRDRTTASGSWKAVTVLVSQVGSQFQLHCFLLFFCLHHSVHMIILRVKIEHFSFCAANKGRG